MNLRANFDTLLTEYPSGMRVNSLLAAKNFGVHQENILVGNGAAELIKSSDGVILMERLALSVRLLMSIPNRYDRKILWILYLIIRIILYTADDLMAFFNERYSKSCL